MAENNKFSKSGRKPLVDEEVNLIFRKLEPFLIYVLYARKSTDDLQRQARSIGDQMTLDSLESITSRGGEN